VHCSVKAPFRGNIDIYIYIYIYKIIKKKKKLRCKGRTNRPQALKLSPPKTVTAKGRDESRSKVSIIKEMFLLRKD
jgi:hypothetical protein